eukprot:1155282-Pelagomonas_calceolata.AAC.1
MSTGCKTKYSLRNVPAKRLMNIVVLHVLRSRHGTSQRSSVANRVRQPRQLNATQWHVHLIEIKYCDDKRPGQQLEAAQRQHADLRKLISAKTVTLHSIL